jgi:hypothetical protein
MDPRDIPEDVEIDDEYEDYEDYESETEDDEEAILRRWEGDDS